MSIDTSPVTKKPLLTIAVPTYNSSKYIKRLVKSILIQDLKDTELIFVDDGSSDNTLEIIESIFVDELFREYKIYKNIKNVGLDLNVINCLKRSKGNFVWLLGHDDFLALGAVSAVISALTEAHDIGGLFLNYSIFDNTNEQIVKQSWVTEIDKNLILDGDEFWTLLGAAPSFISSMIHNKEIALSTNFERYIGTDWLDFAIILEYAKKSKMSALSGVHLIAAGDSSETPWNTKGAALMACCDLAEIILSHRADYSSSALTSLKRSMFLVLKRKGISARAAGLNISKELFVRLKRNFGEQSGYYLFMFSIIVPGAVYRFLLKIYHQRHVKKLYWLLKKT